MRVALRVFQSTINALVHLGQIHELRRLPLLSARISPLLHHGHFTMYLIFMKALLLYIDIVYNVIKIIMDVSTHYYDFKHLSLWRASRKHKDYS